MYSRLIQNHCFNYNDIIRSLLLDLKRTLTYTFGDHNLEDSIVISFVIQTSVHVRSHNVSPSPSSASPILYSTGKHIFKLLTTTRRLMALQTGAIIGGSSGGGVVGPGSAGGVVVHKPTPCSIHSAAPITRKP